MKVLVVGAVAGGATALARLRRLDEDAEIIVFERGGYISYANCGLPYYIGEQIKNRESLFVSDKDTIEAKYGVEIRLNSNVESIDRERRMIEVKNPETGEVYEETYDKLLLSTGSSPFVPNPAWLDQTRVFKLWTIPDTDSIYEFVVSYAPKRAVIVGGGFIGLEMAENLSDRGVEVSLCDMADQVMPPIDKDMAKIVEVRLAEHGVHLHLGNGLKDIENDGTRVVLADGTAIETDLVILSIGVKPNSQLAEAAGLELNARRGIKVDEFMHTSDPNIYAVGDVIGVQDYILGGEVMIPLAGPANKQGRNVAENILGLGQKTYDGTLGTSVAKIFDMTVASTGASEKSLSRAGKVYGKDYHVSLVHPMSHAGYYPGATP
ncbi:NAD(P)/FAD-dependent oxidoreductase, partial [Mogibacterium timidum]